MELHGTLWLAGVRALKGRRGICARETPRGGPGPRSRGCWPSAAQKGGLWTVGPSAGRDLLADSSRSPISNRSEQTTCTVRWWARRQCTVCLSRVGSRPFPIKWPWRYSEPQGGSAREHSPSTSKAAESNCSPPSCPTSRRRPLPKPTSLALRPCTEQRQRGPVTVSRHATYRDKRPSVSLLPFRPSTARLVLGSAPS